MARLQLYMRLLVLDTVVVAMTRTDVQMMLDREGGRRNRRSKVRAVRTPWSFLYRMVVRTGNRRKDRRRNLHPSISRAGELSN